MVRVARTFTLSPPPARPAHAALVVLVAGLSSTTVTCAGHTGQTTAPPPAASGGPARCTVRLETAAPAPGGRFALRYDQLGYAPGGAPWAVLVGQGGPAPGVRFFDAATGCEVGAGARAAGPRVLATTSLAGTPLSADVVDLAPLAQPGAYLVVLEDGTRFGPITVGARVHAPALAGVVKFLRAQRCGPTTAAVSGHGACHLHRALVDGDPATLSGDAIVVADGAKGRVDQGVGPAVDVEGGWHDAGDYIKFVGTTAFTLTSHLLALRDHGPALERVAGQVVVRELRDELRWGLDWLAKMVGGAEPFHQVSGEPDHDVAFRAPEADTQVVAPPYQHRPVFRMAPGQGANLLGRSAAALAIASSVYAATDPAYAARLLAVARRAYAAAAGRPRVQNPNPPSFYHEDSVEDDLALGAAALARVTGDAALRSEALAHARKLGRGEPAISWGHVDALAFAETAQAFAAGSAERAEMLRALLTLAHPLVETGVRPRGPGAAFRYALPRFGIDSLADDLGAAATCALARRLTSAGNAGTQGALAGCLQVAHDQLHFLWGQNPFGLSFQLGVGQRFPQHPHHAWAAGSGVVLAGAVVGGPSELRNFFRDRAIPKLLPTSAHARWSTEDLAYDDQTANWLTNEPALDFTAGLLLVLGEVAEGA